MNSFGQTALTIAAHFGNKELATLLIEHGADVNKKEKGTGTTALMWACLCPKLMVTIFRNLVKFSDYISKFGQFGYSLILTLFRNIVKF